MSPAPEPVLIATVAASMRTTPVSKVTVAFVVKMLAFRTVAPDKSTVPPVVMLPSTLIVLAVMFSDPLSVSAPLRSIWSAWVTVRSSRYWPLALFAPGMTISPSVAFPAVSRVRVRPVVSAVRLEVPKSMPPATASLPCSVSIVRFSETITAPPPVRARLAISPPASREMSPWSVKLPAVVLPDVMIDRSFTYWPPALPKTFRATAPPSRLVFEAAVLMVRSASATLADTIAPLKSTTPPSTSLSERIRSTLLPNRRSPVMVRLAASVPLLPSWMLPVTATTPREVPEALIVRSWTRLPPPVVPNGASVTFPPAASALAVTIDNSRPAASAEIVAFSKRTPPACPPSPASVSIVTRPPSRITFIEAFPVRVIAPPSVSRFTAPSKMFPPVSRILNVMVLFTPVVVLMLASTSIETFASSRTSPAESISEFTVMVMFVGSITIPPEPALTLELITTSPVVLSVTPPVPVVVMGLLTEMLPVLPIVNDSLAGSVRLLLNVTVPPCVTSV